MLSCGGTSAQTSSTEKYPTINQAARAFRAADPMRPVSADVWDGFQRYSRGIDQMLIGVHRWPLLTGLEIVNYRNWLMARKRLAQPGTFYWTWIQTHLPDWFLQTAYGKGVPTGGPGGEPLGPQAEQVALAGLHGDRLRLPRTGILVGPIPFRRLHGSRSLAGTSAAQSGDRVAGTLAGGGGDSEMDRHVKSECQGGGHSHRQRRSRAADLDGAGLAICSGSVRRSRTELHGTPGTRRELGL